MPAPRALTRRALNRATLARQGLLAPFAGITAADAVHRAGSLQAQHPEWPPVALASRALDGAGDLASALDDRSAVRSSLMRLTIHVVSAADLWPMFTACQPLRLDQWRRLIKADPTDSELGRRMTASHAVALAALAERPRSSLELDQLMAAEIGEIATSVTRPAWREPLSQVVVRAAWRHFAAFVPLVHVPHEREGYGRSLYAVAESWLGERRPAIDERAARAHVARRYLAAFGPASLDDLAAYVGRGKGGLAPWREALAAIGSELVELPDEDGRTVYDLADAPRPGAGEPAPARLLARWDSLLLSHAPKHRGRVIHESDRARVFSRNADVLPTLLVDGVVSGTWDLSRREGTATIELRPFGRLATAHRRALEAEAHRILQRVASDAATRTVQFAR